MQNKDAVERASQYWIRFVFFTWSRKHHVQEVFSIGKVIFNLPGMGTAILEGIQGNEAMLVQGVVVVVALSFIIINIVVDMLYILINPRIRTV